MLVACALAFGQFSSSAAPVSGVLPAAAPAPAGNTAVITVKVGADRIGAQTVAGLAGVQLGLFASATATSPVNNTWAVCTSDGDGPDADSVADGDCSFVVPDTQVRAAGNCGSGSGANCDRRFYIKQISAPAGWRVNATLRTGSNDGTQSQETPYVFQTGSVLRAGNTYTSAQDFMIGSGTTNRVASGGVWQQSRDNPALPTKCGLNVALILDLSSSVALSGTLGQLKAATGTFVDSLVGTPSRVALFSFSTVSPAIQGAPNYPDLYPVSTQAQANTVKARYSSWQANGSTNWDQGLYQPSVSGASALNHYDVAVVITDGNPTAYSNPTDGAQTYNRLREMENGIFAANALKELGTRVIAVGVGSGVTQPQTALNLAAISGPVAYDEANPNASTADYYQTSDYASAGADLRNMVFKGCTPSLSVVKAIIPYGGTIADAVPASTAWTFAASKDPGDTVTGLPSTRQTATDGTGAVNFPLAYTDGDDATVTINETQQSGYSLTQQSGDNASCTLKSASFPTGTTVPVANVGTLATDPGVSFTMPPDSSISCIFYNQAPSTAADVTVTKKWVINGEPFAQGTQPPAIGAALFMDGPNTATETGQGWGVTRTGYSLNDHVMLGEGMYFGDLPLCSLTSSQVTAASGADTSVGATFPATLDADPTSFLDAQLTSTHGELEVTNTVTCQSHLALTKRVEGGSASPSLWTLAAIAPSSAMAGPSGATGANGFVTPDVPYQLAETGGDPAYVQVDERTDLAATPDDEATIVAARSAFPSSTGSMYCAIVDATGDPISSTYDGLNGAVTVPLGQRVSCEAVNQTSTLTLLKVVQNEFGNSKVPADWKLTATPTGDNLPAGLGPVTVTGNDVRDALAAGTNTFNVRPGVPYEFSESGPGAADHYEQTGFGCEEVLRTRTPSLTLAPLSSWVCTFTNTDRPDPWTAHKTSEPKSGSEVAPGDVITYTIKASRQATGSGDPRDLTMTDDMSDVLDDATLVDGSVAASEGTATLSGTTLTWKLATLASTATLTYRVRINNKVKVGADAEEVELRNVLDAPGAENCEPVAARATSAVAARESADCETEHVLGEEAVGPDLANTGTSPLIKLAYFSGLAALLAGAVLIVFGVERRRRS